MDTAQHGTDTGRQTPGRRRRAWRVVGALALAVLVGWLWTRDTSPVGHFTSTEAQDRFTAAYDRAMADLPAPDAVLDVRTGYGVVRFYRFDGPDPGRAPLVLLPGRASASPVWADDLPSLRAVRTVYTVDLLGEPGASVQSRPIETDADQARWLDEALAGLPEPRVHLLGLSIGGWTATNLAVHAPDRIASLVLLDPATTFAPLPFEVVVRSIPASVRWLPRSWRDSFGSWTAGGAPVEDVPVAEMIEAGMQTYALELPTPSPFPDEALRGIDVPVLAILAGRSVMHDAAAAAEHASATLPNATVTVYPDATHALNGEYPEEIAADVATFLSTVEA